MKFLKTLLASAALVASVGASAQVVAETGGGYGTFLSLSSAGLGTAPATSDVATLVGGTVYSAGEPFAALPAGTAMPSSFLAAGPSSGAPATLSFTSGVSYISFLWGSPDTYNMLTVTSTLFGAETFDVSDFSFSFTNGNQAYSSYVQFFAGAGNLITSLSFDNVPAINAFETANYSITPVPEPETYALMLAGLGAIGFIARRRKQG